jgi:hypothetical protein
MKTKFKIKGYLPLLLSIVLTAIIVNFIIEFFTNSFYQEKPFVTLIVLTFFLLTLTWLVLGEVKNKFIIVKFSDEKIFLTKMGGLLSTKEISSAEIEGWKYSILTSRGGNDEYLYLYSKGKKIAKISEFYHRNYSEIKQHIKSKYKDLGFEQFSYLDELKEMFE